MELSGPSIAKARWEAYRAFFVSREACGERMKANSQDRLRAEEGVPEPLFNGSF